MNFLVARAWFTEVRKILCRKEQCPPCCVGTRWAGVGICALNSPSLVHSNSTESKSLIRSKESSSLDLKALALRTHSLVFRGSNYSCLECGKWTLHKGSWNPDDESQNNDMIPHLGNAVKCVSSKGLTRLMLKSFCFSSFQFPFWLRFKRNWTLVQKKVYVIKYKAKRLSSNKRNGRGCGERPDVGALRAVSALKHFVAA